MPDCESRGERKSEAAPQGFLINVRQTDRQTHTLHSRAQSGTDTRLSSGPAVLVAGSLVASLSLSCSAALSLFGQEFNVGAEETSSNIAKEKKTRSETCRLGTRKEFAAHK